MMRQEIIVGNNTIQLEAEEKMYCEYSLLIDEIDTSLACIQYGIKVSVKGTEESAEVWNISHRADHVLGFTEMLCRLSVTPCTLRDVVDDFLLIELF